MKIGLQLLMAALLSIRVFANDPSSVFSFSAAATGVDPSTPLEFILITPDSGHDYESIAISRLSAEEILEGLRKLGALPGHTADSSALRFWPKGEWLDIEISFERDGRTVTVPVGELVYNLAEETTLADEHWTFCGSAVMLDDEGNPALAADIRDPGSILSVYNDPETLIDRSVRAPKGSVYGSLIVNTNFQLLEDLELTVSIRRKSSTPRFQTREVSVEGGTDGGLLKYHVQLDEQAPLDLDGGTDSLATGLRDIEEEFPNLCLTLLPGLDLSLAQVRSMYEQTMALEENHGYRLNPPVAPHFFFQSFLPDPAFRSPESRPSQPWELHIRTTPEGPALRLIRYTVEERDVQGEPTLTQQQIEVENPGDLQQHLALKKYDLPVLLVFAPPSLRYGDLIDLLSPLRESYDTYYFYFDE